MNEKIAVLTQGLSVNEKLSDELFSEILLRIKLDFSEDYLGFMKERNGGEGFVNEAYVVFWRMEELEELNTAYMVETFAPGLFFIGSNGGGSAFGIRKTDASFIEVPFIGMSDDIAEKHGDTFVELLSYLSSLD